MCAYRGNSRCVPSNQTGNQTLDIARGYTPCLLAYECESQLRFSGRIRTIRGKIIVAQKRKKSK